VSSDGKPTPQYDRLGRAFKKLKELTPTLAPLTFDAAATSEVKIINPSAGGALATVLSDPNTSKHYLMVVAGFEIDADQSLQVELPSRFSGPVIDPATGTVASRSSNQLIISLPAGEGRLYELHDSR
jgi:hypothetical protein